MTKDTTKMGLSDLESKRDSRRVAKSKEKRSGWDDDIRKDKKRLKERGFSDFFTEGSKVSEKRELILRGFSLASAFVKSMDLPFTPLLSVKSGESFTTGKVIVLNTDVFDSELSEGQKLDVFIGLAIHECCHCAKTDFEANRDFFKKISDTSKRKLCAWISNVIEDERIELEDAAENPGHGNFLAATKDYYHNIDLEYEPGINTLGYLVGFFCALVRYPDRITPEMYKDFEKEYEEAKTLLNPFPTQGHEVLEISLKFTEFILKLHRKLVEDAVRKSSKKPHTKSKEDSSSEAADEDWEESDEDDGEEGDDDKRKSKDSSKSGSCSDSKDKESDAKLGDSGKGEVEGEEAGEVPKGDAEKGEDKEADSDKSEFPVEKAMSAKEENEKKKMEERISDEVDSIVRRDLRGAGDAFHMKENTDSTVGGAEVKKSRSINDKTSDYIEAEFAKTVILSDDAKVRYLVGKGNRTIYDRESEHVSKFAATLARMLQFNYRDEAIVLRGMRHGRLDTNRLAEAVQGVPTIYETFGRIKSPKGVVGLLVDESYSMHWNGKMSSARRAAIVFEKAIEKLKNIELFIYGHTADEGASIGETEIRIYRERGINIPYGVGGCESREENRDGDAILATVRRIRKITDLPGVLFVISDGEPMANNYSGDEAIDDVKAKVIEAEKLGFVVIQIAIYESPAIARMFRRYVIIESVSELPVKLGLIMKSVVSDLFEAVTTYG